MNQSSMPSAHEREAALFALAAERSADERPGFLAAVCGRDAALRQRLEALLAAHERPGEALGETVGISASRATLKVDLSDQPSDEAVGQVIGRYKLLEKVGEGGCGVVYVAEQTEPVRRRVALKVIKLGMDTKQVVARFEAERQALAMMDHPNIAKVLDAGSTEQGRPYFVMELVRGIRITDYCDQTNLSTKERLDLFTKVCHAIQHAHQKGIIHRDIKPSNILVTLHDGVPVPKVIDFGIAKATEGRLTDATVYTQLHQFIGTPAYMSPEQAEMSGLDIDTRSDIYSLGVLLYELLTGKTPFDARELMAAGLDALRKTIREMEPAKPSTRLATLQGEELTTTAKRRSVESSKLVNQLRGDLDWIVMKCLEKDRSRRYDTANGLAADLKRHLDNEPVVARPPSSAYKFQKAFRRNKLAFAAGTAIAASLVIGIAVSAWQAIRATHERDAKELARQDAEAISKFLSDVFQSADPERDGYKITVAETLDKATAKLEADPDIPPGRRAILQDTLGRTYSSLGIYPKAIALQEKAAAYFLATFGPEDPQTLNAQERLANSYYDAGRRDEALKLREEVLRLRRKVLGAEHTDTLDALLNLANSYHDAGRKDEALKLREEMLPLYRKLLGPENPATLSALHNLAISYFDAGRKEEALQLKEEVLVLRRKVNGPTHPDTLRALHGLASSYSDAGRMEEALNLSEELLALHLKVSGPNHPDTLSARHTLAHAYRNVGRAEEALKLMEEVAPRSLEVLGPEHPDTFQYFNCLAENYSDAGRTDEAVKLLEQLLALRRKALGPDHPDTLRVTDSLAWTYMDARKYAQAEPLRLELLVQARKSAGTNAAELEVRLGDMAELRSRQQRYAESEAFQRERIESCLRRPGGETSDAVLHSRSSLGRLYSDWAWAERATNCAAAHQRAIEGEKLIREVMDVREGDPKYLSWRKADLQSRLGGALSVVAFTDPSLTADTREPKLVEAEAALQRGLAGMKRERGIEAKYVRDGIERLIRLYEAWPRPDELAHWKQKLAALDEAGAEKNKPGQP